LFRKRMLPRKRKNERTRVVVTEEDVKTGAEVLTGPRQPKRKSKTLHVYRVKAGVEVAVAAAEVAKANRVHVAKMV